MVANSVCGKYSPRRTRLDQGSLLSRAHRGDDRPEGYLRSPGIGNWTFGRGTAVVRGIIKMSARIAMVDFLLSRRGLLRGHRDLITASCVASAIVAA